MRRWGSSALIAVLAVVVLALDVSSGAVAIGVLIAVALGLFAWVNSPALPPRSVPAAEARRRSAADGRPIVFWRPGCIYCIRLRFALLRHRSAGRLHWVDIWHDPEGAAAVREITGGDETVPTVVAGEERLVNPGPGRVRGLLPGARAGG